MTAVVLDLAAARAARGLPVPVPRLGSCVECGAPGLVPFSPDPADPVAAMCHRCGLVLAVTELDRIRRGVALGLSSSGGVHGPP